MITSYDSKRFYMFLLLLNLTVRFILKVRVRLHDNSVAY